MSLTGMRARPGRALAVAASGLAAALFLAACGSSPAAGGGPESSPARADANSSTKATSTSAALAALEKAPSGRVSLSEDGSSLLYPLYQAWAKAYASVDPGFSSTSGADGSGTGITDAETGVTALGASDAYLPPGTARQYRIENIPVAISAQMINYNLPGLAKVHLKLSGKLLAEMYEGKISHWNDPAIEALNPGLSLPELKVVPLHRSDGSGDSFLFSSYLADSAPGSFAAKQGPSTLPAFPSVPGALAAKGNSGMVAACGETPGCVAYIGISYKADTTQAKLGEAMLENRSGRYELPSAATIHAEAGGFPGVPSDGTLSLIYGSAPGGYPIINFEYLIAKTSQPSATTAEGLKAFLAWAIDPGRGSSESYLGQVGFQPLPAGALAVSVKLLEKIG